MVKAYLTNSINMKKFIYFAAVVGLLFTSCTQKEEPMMGESKTPITFETPVVSPATKAEGGKVDFPATMDFSVSAKHYAAQGSDEVNGSFSKVGWTAGSDYMSNVTCAKLADSPKSGYASWGSTTPYYWPKTGYLTFQAFAPATTEVKASFEIDANGTGVKSKESTTYTVAKDFGSTSVDFMYSDRVKDQNSNSTIEANTTNPNNYGAYYGVQLTFRHALSLIKFVAKTKTEDIANNIDIKITSIVLKDVYNVGTFAQGLDDKGNGFAAADPTWTLEASPTKITYDNCLNDGTPVSLTNEFVAQAVKPFYVLPQLINDGAGAGTDNTTAELVVTYTMQVKDIDPVTSGEQHGPVVTYTTGETAETKVLIKDLEFSDDANAQAFKPGRQYTFQIIVDMEQIYFAPLVEDWSVVTVSGDKLTI